MAYLYHVTYLDRLPSIFRRGLEPGHAEGIGGPSFAVHRQASFFLTSKDGLDHWYEVGEEWRKEAPVVVLRVMRPHSGCAVDPIGTVEVEGTAYRCRRKIAGKNIDVRLVGKWIPLQSLKRLQGARTLDHARDAIDDLVFGATRPVKSSKKNPQNVNVRSLVAEALR